VNRIEDFRRWLQRAAADRTIETANGTGIVSDSVPDVYDANYLSVESPSAGAGDLAAEAEAVLVAWDPANRRSRAITDGERATLTA